MTSGAARHAWISRRTRIPFGFTKVLFERVHDHDGRARAEHGAVASFEAPFLAFAVGLIPVPELREPLAAAIGGFLAATGYLLVVGGLGIAIGASVEIGHIVRSHDPCLVCTVHFVQRGERHRYGV